jgi:hypothetical protein
MARSDGIIRGTWQEGGGLATEPSRSAIVICPLFKGREGFDCAKGYVHRGIPIRARHGEAENLDTLNAAEADYDVILANIQTAIHPHGDVLFAGGDGHGKRSGLHHFTTGIYGGGTLHCLLVCLQFPIENDLSRNQDELGLLRDLVGVGGCERRDVGIGCIGQVFYREIA